MDGISITQKIDEALCARIPKPLSIRTCNQHHCNLECRVEKAEDRLPCHTYQRDTRRDAVDFRTRRQACEQVGCCFVPEPVEWKRLQDLQSGGSGAQHECYAKPFRVYPMWMEMAYQTCPMEGIDAPQTKSKIDSADGRGFGIKGEVTPIPSIIPTQSKANLCVTTEGFLTKSSNCSMDTPPTTRECNNMTVAPRCDRNCGPYGVCTRKVVYDHAGWDSWIYKDVCDCQKGYATPESDSTRPCSIDLANKPIPESSLNKESDFAPNNYTLNWRWVPGATTACQQAGGRQDKSGFMARINNCVEGAKEQAGPVSTTPSPPPSAPTEEFEALVREAGGSDGTQLAPMKAAPKDAGGESGSATNANLHFLDVKLCGTYKPKYEIEKCPLCDCALLGAAYGKVTWCNGEQATIEGVVGEVRCHVKSGTWPASNSLKITSPKTFERFKKNFPANDLGNDFIMLEHRTTAAIAYMMKGSFSQCVATCRRTPTCPGFVIGGYTGGRCGMIDPFRMTLNPVNRGSSHPGEDHMVVRKGFLRTTTAPASLIQSIAGKRVWSPDIANKIVAANMNFSKGVALVPTNDAIWDWIDTVLGQQGVPLKKSFFSLGWGVHSNVA